MGGGISETMQWDPSYFLKVLSLLGPMHGREGV